jgi:hypothetical protein
MVGEFSRYPAIFRSPNEVNGLLPLLFGASLIGTIIVAYIFAKGHDGGNGLMEGFRFGIVFAFFGLFSLSIPNYVVYNYGRKLALEGAIAAFIEMVIVGIVLGLVYKPLARTR